MQIQRLFLLFCFAGAACTGTAGGGKGSGGDDDLSGAAGEGGQGNEGGAGIGPVVPGPNGQLFDGARPFEPGPAAFRRLTNEQYQNAVEDILKLRPNLQTALNDDRKLEAFANDETQSDPSSSVIQSYERAATAMAAAATAASHRSQIFSTNACGSTDACLEAFVDRYGLLFFRHKLNASEKEPILAAAKAEAGRQGGDFWAGAKLAFEVLLQSPSFLYTIDIAEAESNETGGVRRSQETIALRLALLLWNSVPDEALLQTVNNGKLASDAEVLEVANDMIEREPQRFVRAGRHFFREWLGYDLTKFASKSPVFADFNDAVATSMVSETDALLEDLIKSDRAMMEIFEADTTVADERLRKFYGDGDLEDLGDGRFRLPQARKGILSHASVIAAHSAFERQSPTLRGKFVLERVLCGAIADPPPDAPAELPASQSMPETVRERTERYMLGDGKCNVCHNHMDGLGFAFEHFDASGKYREFEAVEGAPEGRKPVSAKAFISFLDIKDIDGLPGLAKVLRDSPDAEACLVKNVFTWATGRKTVDADERTLADMHAEAREGAGAWTGLLRGLVRSGALTYKSAL